MRDLNKIEIPIWEKLNLTLEEASAYTNIGINKLRDEVHKPNCNFVLKIGSRKIIKRKELEIWNSEQKKI